MNSLNRNLLFAALIVCAAVLLPSLAYAQAQIVGQVRDESGGVLPGVTVEAASLSAVDVYCHLNHFYRFPLFSCFDCFY